jgi:hypothetical protein
MAQGGQGWPGGHFDGNGSSNQHTPDNTSGTLGYDNATYDFQHFGSSSTHPGDYLYPSGFSVPASNQTSGGYSPSNFATGSHPTAEVQQRFSEHDLYANPNYRPEVNGRPVSQAPPYSDVTTYGASAYSGPGFSYNNAQPIEPTRVTGDYINQGWQPQASQHAQSQFTPSAVNFNDHGMYDHQFGVMSQPHVPTPPPGQRPPSHFVADQGGLTGFQSNPSAPRLGNDGGRVVPPSGRLGESSHQFQTQPIQFVNSTFQATEVPSGASRNYQGQVPQPGQPAMATGQMKERSASTRAISQPPLQASRVQVDAPRTAAPINNTLSRPNIGMSFSPAPSASRYQNIAQAQTPEYVEVPQASSQRGITAHTISPENRVGPLQVSWKPVQSFPNMFISDKPVSREDTDPRWLNLKMEAVDYNSGHLPILPGRSKRLPCEIKRDFEAVDEILRDQHPDDTQRKALVRRAEQLKSEMEEVNGGKKGKCLIIDFGLIYLVGFWRGVCFRGLIH